MSRLSKETRINRLERKIKRLGKDAPALKGNIRGYTTEGRLTVGKQVREAEGKVKKANENPNKKLEEQGNTTKSNMGEGRIKIDALDKLMKRGKYAPVKKAKGGAVHTMPDGSKMKGAKHGMKAGGYVLSAEDKERKKIFESSPPAKRGIPIKKSATKEMKHGGLVDRNYLKGK
jgi:hypothetical protein